MASPRWVVRPEQLHTGTSWGLRLAWTDKGSLTIKNSHSPYLQNFQGTDITEAFESHHISTIPESLLKKFFVCDANVPRNSPFTFKDDDFYKVLKRRIREALPDVPGSASDRSKSMADLLLVGYIVTALLAVYFWSFSLGILSGVLLACTTVAAHNFFHQRNNFRMYYFNFSFMNYR